MTESSFDPYYKWLGIPLQEQPPNHYRLLGVPLFTVDLDVIENAAQQRIAHVRSFQLGKHSALSQQLLNELAAAKVCLLSAEQRELYDAALRSQLSVGNASTSDDDCPTELETPLDRGSTFSQAPLGNPPIVVAPPGRHGNKPPTTDRMSASTIVGGWIVVIVIASLTWYWMANTNNDGPVVANQTTPDQATSPELDVDEPDENETIGYRATTREVFWQAGTSPKNLVDDQQGFAVLTGIGGNFAGLGEEVGVRLGDDQQWQLYGRSQKPLVARAVSISGDIRSEFQPEVEIFKWQRGGSAVKMIHKSDGFCFLSSVSGKFRGGGEQVEVYVAADGYWYLGGHAAQSLAATATAVRVKQPGTFSAAVNTHGWRRGARPQRMIHQDDGFCFLSSVGGKLAGLGESVRVHPAADGYWYLEGQSQQPLEVKATSIEFRHQ